jgi:hypothetical protein
MIHEEGNQDFSAVTDLSAERKLREFIRVAEGLPTAKQNGFFLFGDAVPRVTIADTITRGQSLLIDALRARLTAAQERLETIADMATVAAQRFDVDGMRLTALREIAELAGKM